MLSLPRNTALLIIDVQKGLDDPSLGERNNLFAEDNMRRLLEAWREADRPIYHVQHLSTEPNSPLRPELPGCEIKDEVKPLPGEPLFQKNVNSAFIGTNLEQELRANGHDTLVVVGLTTQHCVSTSVRMAGNLGFETYLVADGTAAHESVGHDGVRFSAEQTHAISLATLHNEFATVVETETVLNALR